MRRLARRLQTRLGRVELTAQEQSCSILPSLNSRRSRKYDRRVAIGINMSTSAREDLRVLDLVDGIPTLHPFTDETLAWSVEFSDLLQSFAEALSTPLARSDDISDYLPS